MKYNKQQWAEFINGQQQSNLSIAAFCREHDISIKRFYYHRSQHMKRCMPSAFIQAKPPSAKPAISTTQLTLQCGRGVTAHSRPFFTNWVISDRIGA